MTRLPPANITNFALDNITNFTLDAAADTQLEWVALAQPSPALEREKKMKTATVREIKQCELQAIQADAILSFSVPYAATVTAAGWYAVEPPVRVEPGKLYVAILPSE